VKEWSDGVITAEQKLDFYRRMLLIRTFEEKINFLFSRGLILGTTHLCIGQEASAVGVCASLSSGDKVIGNHRSHGHALAMGLLPEKLMGELLGKRNGYCGGIGGSQHVASVEDGFLGSNGITCGGMPVAVGVAFALKRKFPGNICTVFIGDGATNQGVFHESMNLAAIWNLPLLVVCENNLYAMSTPYTETIAGTSLERRGEAYDIRTTTVDGMDVLAVYEAASECVGYIRSQQKPCFLLVNTYRFLGHSKSDVRKYRTREEEKQYRAQDPIPRLAKNLIENSITGEEGLKSLKTEARELIESCYKTCTECEHLKMEELFSLVAS
jgi:TPP-dependent pyruvate/acetoin dehydrogenase alpha subunit